MAPAAPWLFQPTFPKSPSRLQVHSDRADLTCIALVGSRVAEELSGALADPCWAEYTDHFRVD